MRSRSRRRVATGLAALAVAAVASACLPPPPPSQPPVLAAACAQTLVGSTPGIVVSAAIDEASGIAASRRVDNVWWVHNDSGDAARVFAIGTAGQTLGEYSLTGASPIDWEDIAAGPGPTAGVSYLYVGDIGDNSVSRSSVQVYRVPEPLVNPASPQPPQALSGVDTLTLSYPDGPHDAEGLFVDPTTRDVFVVTKDFVGGVAGVYRAPAAVAGNSTIAMSKVATVSLGFLQGVTGADITPAGDVIALRTYVGVFLFPRTAGSSIATALSSASCAGAAPPASGAWPGGEPQGEALGFTRDGRGYVTLSEGVHTPIHRFVAP